jgi:hypothetical protein
MHEAPQRCSARVVLRADTALDALRWHWGDAYDVGCDDGVWWYRRLDGLDGTRTAIGPDEVRNAIVKDYTDRPLERMPIPDELAARRERYEAAGVRIWHDAGGWHARWPVKGQYTGITHPSELTGLLDHLDALRDER